MESDWHVVVGLIVGGAIGIALIPLWVPTFTLWAIWRERRRVYPEYRETFAEYLEAISELPPPGGSG